MKLKVDKGIPIPPANSKGRVYPLDTMDVGDSFAVPLAKSTSVLSMASRLRAKKFASRRLIENDTKVLRIWRTE